MSGRTLVGLRFWNQVDDDGESYWVFESRDVRLSRCGRISRWTTHSHHTLLILQTRGEKPLTAAECLT